jgi:hypothetical protein
MGRTHHCIEAWWGHTQARGYPYTRTRRKSQRQTPEVVVLAVELSVGVSVGVAVELMEAAEEHDNSRSQEKTFSRLFRTHFICWSVNANGGGAPHPGREWETY